MNRAGSLPPLPPPPTRGRRAPSSRVRSLVAVRLARTLDSLVRVSRRVGTPTLARPGVGPGPPPPAHPPSPPAASRIPTREGGGRAGGGGRGPAVAGGCAGRVRSRGIRRGARSRNVSERVRSPAFAAGPSRGPCGTGHRAAGTPPHPAPPPSPPGLGAGREGC